MPESPVLAMTPEMRASRLMIVEDCPAVGHLLAKRFSAAAPLVVKTVSAALDVVRMNLPLAGAILDVALPDGSGITVLRVLRERNERVPVLVLTATHSASVANDAHVLGAAYSVKPARRENLRAFEEQLARHRPTGDAALARGLTAFADEHGLSPCERRILHLAVEDVPRDQYAERLGVSENTVKTQIRALVGKCPPATDASGAARVALRWIVLTSM